MGHFPSKMWWLLLFSLLASFLPTPTASCQFGECTHWRILLVPLLTDKFTQVPLLKAIVRSMLSGCRWYFPDQIRLELFTKNHSFVPIKDPIMLPELDQMLGQFKFTSLERRQREGEGQWQKSVEMALSKMNGTELRGDSEGRSSHFASSSSSSEEEEGDPEWGRFIFVITDFGQSQAGHGSEFLTELDKELSESDIHFRNVRLQFDGNKQTHIIPGGGSPHFREDIVNISSQIVRLAIVEPGIGFDAFAAVRPCPQLNDAQKIREYSYVQHFYYENWFLRRALIGFGLFLCAILCAISAYFFHLWELARARRKAARQQQTGGGAGGAEKGQHQTATGE